MSMSTHVVGFKPPDEKWKGMKAIWDSCQAAGIVVPKEVEKFFNYDPPDDQGVKVNLEGLSCVTSWEDTHDRSGSKWT